MTLLMVLASASAILWLSIVVLGLLGRRPGTLLAAGLTGAFVMLPFLPRLTFFAYDRERFLASYGTWALAEIQIGVVSMALGAIALLSAPLALRFAWAWLIPGCVQPDAGGIPGLDGLLLPNSFLSRRQPSALLAEKLDRRTG